MKRSLNVVAIGGRHQYPHFLPVAFELHARGTLSVTIFVPGADDREAVIGLADRLGLPVPPIVEMRLPAVLEQLTPKRARKLLMLLVWQRTLRDAEALLAAERTSTILRKLPGRRPLLLHIPHGAGDRAVGFEKRIALFDHVLTAGVKDRDRLIEAGRVAAARCHVIGPVKLAAMARIDREGTPLFPDRRPIILYNPHFDRTIGSFDSLAARLIDVLAGDDRWNLIVAPHVRLAEHWDAAQRAAWEARAVPGKVIVDLGSQRSVDMTYTLAADLYLGDVSSQVYEFLVRPRPCLFVNAHGAAWADDPDYAMWHFGPVISPDADLRAAIADSFTTHDTYRPEQVRRTQAALGDQPWRDAGSGRPDPIVTAAELIETLVAPRREQS